jgi:hypothetical protein
MRVDKRQPRASPPMTQKPRLDILKLKVPFKEDIFFEEYHRRSDVVRHPLELLNRILFFFGEGIRGVEGDFEAEYRIRELRLSRRRIWTAEDFGWHVDIDVVGRGGNVRWSPSPCLLSLTWNRVTTSSPRTSLRSTHIVFILQSASDSASRHRRTSQPHPLVSPCI